MDILDEIKIKQSERRQKATTESQKIASLNDAYRQASRVKIQREIDALRKKSADLQVSAIDQEVKAQRDITKASEDVSRQQKLRSLSRDIYLDMLSKGQYDKNVLSGLGISEAIAKSIVSKVNAAKARKSGSSGGETDQQEEIPTTEETPTQSADQRKQATLKVMGVKDTSAVTENQQQMATDTALNVTLEQMNAEKKKVKTAADRRAMNDDVEGIGQRGLDETQKKNKAVQAIQEQTGASKQEATQQYNLQKATQKYGREKVYEAIRKYAGTEDDIYTFAYKFMEKVTKNNESGNIVKLTTTERNVLQLLKTDGNITEDGKELIDTALHNDTVYKVKAYGDFLKSLSDNALELQLTYPADDFGLGESQMTSLAYAEYWERNPTEYAVWVLSETGEQTDEEAIQERAEAVSVLEARIAELDKEIADLELDPTASDAMGPGLHYMDPVKHNELQYEKERLQNTLIRYQSGTGETDKRYEEYSSKGDWESNSVPKSDNPTVEDINKWYTDVFGGIVVDRKTGEEKEIKPRTEETEPQRESIAIKEPLSFYFYVKDYTENEKSQNERYAYHPYADARAVHNSLDSEGYEKDWDQLSEREKKVYYYKFNTLGKKKAMEYLDSLTTELNYRATVAHAEELKKAGGWDLAAMNVFSVPANIFGGITAFAGDTINVLSGKDINPYDAAHSMQNFAGSVRSETAERINRATKSNNPWLTWGDAYQGLMSGADSLVGAALFGKGYSAVMGMGAASATARDLYERGATKGQIMVGAITSGAIELVTEKLALDNFFKIKNAKSAKQWFMNTLKQGFPEAAEEMVAELGNTFVDILNMRTNSQWAQLVEESGSVSKALLQTAQDLFRAGATGFISGAALGGLGSTADYVANQAAFSSEGKRILEDGQGEALLKSAQVTGILASDKAGKNIGKLAERTSAEQATGEGIGKLTAGIKNSVNRRNLGRLSAEMSEYNYIRQQTVRGVKLDDIIKATRQSGYYTAAQVRKIYGESKANFVNSLTSEARAAYKAVGLDVPAQNTWLQMYDAGVRGAEISFKTDALTVPQAKAAYNFGKESVQPIQTTGSQNSNEPVSTAMVADELANELFYAGLNGVDINEVADLKGAGSESLAASMQAIYDSGAQKRTELGTEQGVYRAGSGKVINNTGRRRTKTKADIETMRKFARTHHLDVEILPDGTIEGKAAYDVAAFKILMGESTETVHFYHEVFENMQAIHPDAFNELRKAMMAHFLQSNSMAQFNDEIAEVMKRYNTNDYALGRKEWVCTYAAKLLDTPSGRNAFSEWLNRNDHRNLGQKIADFFRNLWRAIQEMCNGDDIGAQYKKKGQQISANLQNILDLLEQTRARQSSLQNGQTIDIGGGRESVRNSLPFFSLKTNDVNRIGWAEELFSNEDKMLLNDRFVDIMIHKNLGDAIRLKGGSYLLDVNNKIVIIGGSFKNPIIHFVMAINAENATYAHEIKEVIFKHEKFKFLTAREVSKRIEIFETHFGQGIVRGYNRQNFGYNEQSTDVYARLPEGFSSYGYTGEQQNGRGVSAEDGSNGKIRFSKETAAEEETEEKKKVLPSPDARQIGELTAEMDEMARNHGRLPQGERISRDIAVPRKVGKKKTMRWVRTFFESDVGEPDMVEPIADEVLQQGMSYNVMSDQTALNRAEQFIGTKGYESALQDFYNNVERTFNLSEGKQTVARGQLLLRAAAERKDYHNFKKLVVILSEIETLAGQTVQAASMLKKMSGEVKLFEVKRTVDRLNRDLLDGKYGKKGKGIVITMEDDTAGEGRITISKELIERLLDAGNDGDAANAAVVEIYKDVARQMPSSKMDKWNTWRYFAMLANPTTHFRNILSNAAFVVPVEIKNSLQWAIECGAGVFKKDMERTASIGWSKEARAFAKQDALEMELSLKSGGKYNEQDVIEQARDRFKSRWLNWIDKGSRLNGGLLEREDWFFLRNHYTTALARYITANKIDVNNISPEQLEKARQYATKQAQKATFRDASKFSNALSAFSKAHPAANVLTESLMPFKKTPINILKRGMEYSPLGLLAELSYGSWQLKQGKISVNEYIERVAAGLTGSMIVGLGYFLAKIGWLQGGFGRDDDDKKDKAKDKLLRLTGVQEYSLTIGGMSYTLDWMAPTAIPLFMGVELYEALQDQDANVLDRVFDAVIDGTDVIIETSMLNGLQGFIDGIKYDDNAVLGILSNTAINYGAQALPTVAGKFTATLDGKRRINYINKNSWAPSILQEIGNKFHTKFWPWAKPVYYDEFGREQYNQNLFGRFVQNFFSPGYYSTIKSGDLEEVMMEIYETVDEPSPIPSAAAKYFKVNGETKQLTGKEYEIFSKERGKLAYEIMQEVIKSSKFTSMHAEEQANILKEAYSYANAIAKTKAAGCSLDEVLSKNTDWVFGTQEIEKNLGLSNVLIYRQLTDPDIVGSEKRRDAIPILQKAGLSEKQAFKYAGKIRSDIASDIDGTEYASSDIYVSVTSGGDMYKEIYQDILRAYMKNGKSEKEAKAAIKRGTSQLFKADYLEGDGKKRAKVIEQMTKCELYGSRKDVIGIVYDWAEGK